MAWRELHVRYRDGTRRREGRERDTPVGRRELGKQADLRLAWPAVEAVEIGAPVGRSASDSGRGKGRYR